MGVLLLQPFRFCTGECSSGPESTQDHPEDEAEIPKGGVMKVYLDLSKETTWQDKAHFETMDSWMDKELDAKIRQAGQVRLSKF